MPTSSKVLTILIILAMFGWMVLISGVASLNESYGKKVEEINQQITQRESDLSKTKSELNAAVATYLINERRSDSLAADAQTRRESQTSLLSMTTETQTRLDFQQKAMDTAQGDATKNRDFRKAELTALREEIAKKEELSKAIQAENARKRALLAELQSEFKSRSESNRKTNE